MNTAVLKVRVARWIPLLRALTVAALACGITIEIGEGQWGWVVIHSLILVGLFVQPVVDLVHQRRNSRLRRCTICGERPEWLYSLIPPPSHPDRSLNRNVLPVWALWSACPAHDARVRQVVEEILQDGAEIVCNDPDHNHADLRLYGVSVDYAKRGHR